MASKKTAPADTKVARARQLWATFYETVDTEDLFRKDADKPKAAVALEAEARQLEAEITAEIASFIRCFNEGLMSASDFCVTITDYTTNSR